MSRRATKPTPAAVAFRAKIEAEGPDWPKELRDAATLLRCELDRVTYKHWRPDGPARLAEYSETFGRLYAEWRTSHPIS